MVPEERKKNKILYHYNNNIGTFLDFFFYLFVFLLSYTLIIFK